LPREDHADVIGTTVSPEQITQFLIRQALITLLEKISRPIAGISIAGAIPCVQTFLGLREKG